MSNRNADQEISALRAQIAALDHVLKNTVVANEKNRKRAEQAERAVVVALKAVRELLDCPDVAAVIGRIKP